MYNILNVIASNAVFGSSSKRISLSLAIVLQIASRCHCPPDNCTPFSNQYQICCFGLSQIESGILYFFTYYTTARLLYRLHKITADQVWAYTESDPPKITEDEALAICGPRAKDETAGS